MGFIGCVCVCVVVWASQWSSIIILSHLSVLYIYMCIYFRLIMRQESEHMTDLRPARELTPEQRRQLLEELVRVVTWKETEPEDMKGRIQALLEKKE